MPASVKITGVPSDSVASFMMYTMYPITLPDIGDIQGIQLHQNPDDGDRDGS